MPLLQRVRVVAAGEFIAVVAQSLTLPAPSHVAIRIPCHLHLTPMAERETSRMGPHAPVSPSMRPFRSFGSPVVSYWPFYLSNLFLCTMVASVIEQLKWLDLFTQLGTPSQALPLSLFGRVAMVFPFVFSPPPSFYRSDSDPRNDQVGLKTVMSSALGNLISCRRTMKKMMPSSSFFFRFLSFYCLFHPLLSKRNDVQGIRVFVPSYFLRPGSSLPCRRIVQPPCATEVNPHVLSFLPQHSSDIAAKQCSSRSHACHFQGLVCCSSFICAQGIAIRQRALVVSTAV